MLFIQLFAGFPKVGIVCQGYWQLEPLMNDCAENAAMIEATVVNPTSFSGYCFPRELISYPVWLYFRFLLSLRMVEEMPAQSATLHQVAGSRLVL